MKNLKMLRTNLNLSQQECAAALNVSKTTYFYYEQGKISPSVATLLKMSDYFDCSIDYLLGHQTSGILHLDSLTADQRKLVGMIQKMDPDTTKYVVGYFSNLTQTPLDDIMGSGEE